jgi:hypothetical protein
VVAEGVESIELPESVGPTHGVSEGIQRQGDHGGDSPIEPPRSNTTDTIGSLCFYYLDRHNNGIKLRGVEILRTIGIQGIPNAEISESDEMKRGILRITSLNCKSWRWVESAVDYSWGIVYPSSKSVLIEMAHQPDLI